jgi:3-deoxy-D-manno-octulosonic-acid transferase
MRKLYSTLLCCVAPLAFALLLWRGLRERGYWRGLGERCGFGASIAPASSIWVHAVSLGEMSAAAPLIIALRTHHPDRPMVITTATPAGRARAAALFAGAADIRYLPYDTPGAVRRFLARIRPGIAVIMETELWPNLLAECANRDVPVVLASARLSARSVSRYKRLGSLFSGVFTKNLSVAAQSAVDAARFVQIGADAARVRVVGNIKFDVSIEAQLIEQGRRLRQSFGSERCVWVAGSTHAGEDEAVLSAHARLLQEQPRALLLLAPRHRDRFEAVAKLLGKSGLRFARRSASASPEHGQVLLVDTLGELPIMYAAADIAFVGGSLVPVGGHNLLEPAALGLPVLSGPFQDNNREIAALLTARGATALVADAAQLAEALARLFADDAERRRVGAAGSVLVEANRGSVAALLGLIEPLLAGAAARTGAALAQTAGARAEVHR